MTTGLGALRILITNVGIGNRTGTEIVAMDLARAYAVEGHSPMIWSPKIDRSVVAELDQLGIPAVESFGDLPSPPDVIHGHHHLETIEALRHFEKAPAIYVVHSGYWWHDAPPHHPRIHQYVAVDEFCRERLIRAPWIGADRITTIYNAVDLQRFQRRASLPVRPLRALMFSNYAVPGVDLDAIADACRLRGISLDTAGAGTASQSLHPAELLPSYDIVLAKGRCALEALAAGCSVILCDTAGLGGIVTPARLTHQRSWNFGFRLLSRPVNAAAVGIELDAYDPVAAAEVTDRIRAEAGLDRAVQLYLSLYRRILELPPQPDIADCYPQTIPIQVDDQAAIKLSLTGWPQSVKSGEHFEIAVQIDNGAGITLATAADWPCLLMYRWLDANSGAMVVAHGFRSILQPPACPGTSGEWQMRIIAPELPGRYIMRVTVIQEGWRWLDALDPPVQATVEIKVTGRDQALQ